VEKEVVSGGGEVCVLALPALDAVVVVCPA